MAAAEEWEVGGGHIANGEHGQWRVECGEGRIAQPRNSASRIELPQHQPLVDEPRLLFMLNRVDVGVVGEVREDREDGLELGLWFVPGWQGGEQVVEIV